MGRELYKRQIDSVEKRNENILSKIDSDALKKMQQEDFDLLKKLFEDFIFQIEDVEFWKEIIKNFPNVIGKCDEIDFKDFSTVTAYAIKHFLDRYHRFQMVINLLLENGKLCYEKEYGYNVLDIGTGPAHTLFALSDYFNDITKICKTENFFMKSEYVEQSSGFKSFLHIFVEYALGQNKRYDVPFHHAKADNAYSFEHDERYVGRRRYKGTIVPYERFNKSRYDIVVINNFITNDEILESFRLQLKKICKYMRNHGLLIIIGATEGNYKYANLYKTIDTIVGKRFKHRKFKGYWKKILDINDSYSYDDYYGQQLRGYQQDIVDFLKKTKDVSGKPLWNFVDNDVQKSFINAINQVPEKTEKEGWKGIHWKVLVYQKYSKYVTRR